MSFVAHMRDRIAGWVHESARSDPHEFARHQAFFAARLGLSLLAVLLIPFYMALQGSLALWEVVVIICALSPLPAMLSLAKWGKFELSQSISLIGYVGACLAFAAGTGGLSAPTMVWLILAPVEALISMSVQGVVIACAFAALIAIIAGILIGWIEPASTLEFHRQIFFVAPAFVFASLLALGAVHMSALRARLERIGAARYQALTSLMGDLVLRQDRGGAVLSASIEAQTLFDLQPRDLMGRGFFERLMVQDRPQFLKTLADAYAGGDTVNCDLRLRTAETPSARGDFFEPVFTWVELRSRRVSGKETDDNATLMSVVRDISREKRREMDIEAARADAERANAWKDRFLANVSHELRTPLNAIIGFSEILGNVDLEPADGDKRWEYAHIIHGSGQHLLDVVNSVLDISKMEAGRFSITPEPFEMRPLLDACCDIVSLRAEQAGVEIKREFAVGLDELNADKRAFKQVLINLLGNALKFTPRGGTIAVGARQDGAFMAVYVSDTGCGMSAYDLPRLGGAFFQAGAADERTYEGTGLGLSVVRGLVGLHGGEISIESGVGLGTCVTVRLPLDCGEDFTGRASARIIAIPRTAAARPV